MMSLRGIPAYRRQQGAPRRVALADVGASGGSGAVVAEFLTRTGMDMAADAQEADAQKVALQAATEGQAAGLTAGQTGAAPEMKSGDTVYDKSFNDAVMGGYVASLDVYSHTQALELAGAHAGDPEGFRAKWEGLTAGILKQQPPQLLPQVQAELAKRGGEAYGHLVTAKAKNDLRVAADKSNATMAEAMAQHERRSEVAWRLGSPAEAQAADASWDEYLSKRTDFDEVGKVEARATYQRTRQRAAVLGEFDRVKGRGLGAAETFISEFSKPGAHEGIDPDDAAKWGAEMERGLGDLRARHAQAVGDLRGRAEDALWRASRGYGADGLPQLAKQATAMGEHDLASRLSENHRSFEMAGELAKLPLPRLKEKVAELDAAARGGTDRASAQRAEVAKSVLAETASGLAKDPIAHARAQGFDVPKVDWNKPETLQARSQAADRLSSYHRFAMPALDKAETEDLAARLDGATPDEKASMLGNIYKGFGRARLPEVLDAIAEKQPEAAHAGALMTHGKDGERVARDILFGAELRKTVAKDGAGAGRQYMPPKDDAFKMRMAELLPHDAVAELSPETLSGLESAVLSSYAAKSHSAGLAQQTSVNLPLIRQAVADVTGGVVELNGKSTIAPVRGMSQHAFDDFMDGITDGDLAGSGISAKDLRANGELRMIEPGRYKVMMNGRYRAKGGPPIVLDIGAMVRDRESR
ncbi:MAG: hypothetical protein H7Y60_17825 [Rhodospirillaceae bacterium]|nr:hypothetical protein [Rhodospirillales bacterium]